MSFHDFWHLSYKCNLLSIPNNRHVISNPIYLGVFPEERINERTKGAWRNSSDVIPMELQSCSVSITVFASGIHAQCNLGQEVIKLEHSEFKIDCLMRSCLEEFPHGLMVPIPEPLLWFHYLFFMQSVHLLESHFDQYFRVLFISSFTLKCLNSFVLSQFMHK